MNKTVQNVNHIFLQTGGGGGNWGNFNAMEEQNISLKLKVHF